MTILKKILWIIVALIPLAWFFSWHLWITPFFGDTVGQLSLVGLALALLAVGIYRTAKGYGRQEPKDNQL